MAKRGRPRKDVTETVEGRAALKREFQKPRRGPEELTIYASGNGALSFVWHAEETNRYGTSQRIATGRHVTMDEARNYMRTTVRGNRLVQQGWRLWSGTGGGPCLIAPIKRTGPDRIKMGDREYRYNINQTDSFYVRDGEIRQVSLHLEILDEPYDEYDVVPDLRTVKNIGTLASAAFFLNHEKDIQAQPPEEFTYAVVEA